MPPPAAASHKSVNGGTPPVIGLADESIHAEPFGNPQIEVVYPLEATIAAGSTKISVAVAVQLLSSVTVTV